MKGFESIDWRVLEKSIKFGLRFANNDDDNDDGSDDSTGEINVELSAQLVAFESIMGYAVDPDNLEKKIIFISKIVTLLEEFSGFFYRGTPPVANGYGGSGESVHASAAAMAVQFTDSVTKLLQPIVESAMYHSDSQYSNSVIVTVASENVLSQVTKLRHHLREENANCNMLTVDDFCHVTFEHFFIWKQVLARCLGGLQRLVTSGPAIIDGIKKEIAWEVTGRCRGVKLSNRDGQGDNRDSWGDDGVNMSNSDGDNVSNRDKQGGNRDRRGVNMSNRDGHGDTHTRLSEFHLETNTSLVYTKSVAQELLRLVGVGGEFDLRLTERDATIGGFDLMEQSVIVLNHFAFGRSKCFHVSSAADGAMFRAGRFIKYDADEGKYVFHNSQQLLTFQDQWHVVGLPRNFICRVVLLLLVKTACPDFVLDLWSDRGTGEVEQYELIYDLDKQFQWNWQDENGG